jgi:hypothetical protein
MNGKAGWNLGWPSVNNLGRWTINWQTPTAGAGKHEFVGGVRKATVVLFGVLFGVFQVEEILMPGRVEDPVEYFLVANPFSQTQETEASGAVGTVGRVIPRAHFFDIVSFLPSWQPPEPPRILELVTFIFRKHFNCQFVNDTFNGMVEYGPMFSLAWPHLFCNREWGAGLVDAYERPRVYDYPF